jgi:hypothetical protein
MIPVVREAGDWVSGIRGSPDLVGHRRDQRVRFSEMEGGSVPLCRCVFERVRRRGLTWVLTGAWVVAAGCGEGETPVAKPAEGAKAGDASKISTQVVLPRGAKKTNVDTTSRRQHQKG